MTYMIDLESGSSLLTEGGSSLLLESAIVASLASIAAQLDLVYEMVRALYLVHGLDPAAPLTVSGSQRTAGAVVQSISDAGGVTTVTRQ